MAQPSGLPAPQPVLDRLWFPGRDAGDRLAICEGLAEAFVLHWHLNISAYGSPATLSPTTGELARLTGWPWYLQLGIWPDHDTKVSSGPGVPDERIKYC
ncbi:MAG: hypothetical protein OXC13_05075 [Caldilineaceae bacterium]|nr:hypothetical protein [Caldilineaceae bacterium]